MKNLIKIFSILFLLSNISNGGNYFLIQKGNSIFIPAGCRLCSDNIIVEEGASFITEDTLSICENDIVTRLGKTLPPAKLISFTANIAQQKNVLLKWETANEAGNLSFEIERSDSDKSGFQKIGLVTTNGNTNSKCSYSYVDKMIQLDRNYYYRIKQINADGSFSILNTIKLDVSSKDKFFLSQNYPNPFNPATKIKYYISPVVDANSLPAGRQVASTTKVQLIVYDILGRDIITLINKEQTPGEYEVEFDNTNLSSGIYFYRFKAGSFIQTKKMILLR